VVKVADGDTITVLVNKTQIRVRLDSIDAPERKQAFGTRSQQSWRAYAPLRARP
jgi:endonuclease YncB( thermonuclease family)